MFLGSLPSQQLVIGSPSWSTFGIINGQDSTNFTTTACRQPLCCNAEGWGPISEVMADFTPCFLDLLISLVAAFGVVFGALSWWSVAKRKNTSEVPKDWRFWTKLTVITALAFTTVLQMMFETVNWPHLWLDDLRLWTFVLVIASLLVISAVQCLEHTRLQPTGSAVVFYWLFVLLVFATKLRSLVLRRIYDENLPFFIDFCLSLGLVCIEFALVWLAPKRIVYDALGDNDKMNEAPSERASVFSILTFSWMTPMMKYGYKNYVTEDDLWNLAKRDSAGAARNAFQDAWKFELKHRKNPSLWIALYRGFGTAYIQGVLFKTGADVFSFVQPQLLRLLMSFIDSYRGHEPQPVANGTAIAVGMFVVSIAQSLCLHQCFQWISQTGIRLKSSLISSVYMKSLRLSNSARAEKSTGDIVNLMAVDCQRVQDASQFGQHLWSAPLQIILCLGSLYQLLGYSMFAGVTIMVIMIPTNGLITTVTKNLQKQQMKNKDARSRLIAEVLSNMKSIKLFGWGQAFMNRISHIRNDQELPTLRKIGSLQAISSFTGSVAPFLVACSTFAVYVLAQKKPLTTEIVFPALTLFHLLTSPLTVLPAAISAGAEASIAIGRLRAFFTADEVQPDAVIRKETAEIGQESVVLCDATFTWDREENKSALEDINFAARAGQLCCLVGRVGAGKSSFIQAVLGDLYKVNGTVTTHGSIAYAAQQAWVLNATVRENIIFGYGWDSDFYEDTVKACALLDDFAQLPHGDETIVGDRGIQLSGGQKARLTLARAVYSRADIYLLDDCLSAVDQHVGRHLIDNVLGPRGLLRRKTRILATNSISAMMEADVLVMIQDGKIRETGTYNQLKAMDGEFASLISRASNSDQSDAESQPDSDDTAAANGCDILGQNKHTRRHSSNANRPGPPKKQPDVEMATSRTKSQKEIPRQGGVSWNIYGGYAKASNLFALSTYFIALLSAQTAELGSNLWLKQWSESNGKSDSNTRIGMYIGIYVAFGISSAGLVLAQNVVMFLFCAFSAARNLHDRMMVSIFKAPMSFIETTPAGRVLNRFSSDMYRVDEGLPRQFNQLFGNIIKILFILGIISATTPIFAVLIIPLALIYIFMQRYYLKTKRELKRLDSTSRSPVFAFFQESLGGVTTIRAYGQQTRFCLENEGHLDTNMRAYFPSISANRWLGVRLEFIGSIIIFSAAGFAIASVSMGGALPTGMVGLAISYALQITQLFNGLVRLTGEVETNIVAVERVLEYTQLPSEAPDIIPNHRPSTSWPAHGAVRFVDYSTRYRPGLPLVLQNLNFDIRAQEKIGVVGRTGAGKSSLALSLFRIIEPSGGSIHIDDLDISSIGLLDLRQHLTVIPQDTALFGGTVRENLDPLQVHDDTELWTALDLARLKEYVAGMSGGLDAKVYEGGSNLSQGQKQLISLARALLTPSSILVLDEATAAVDVETDALLQETLRKSLSNRTIITIAHRINTIIDSDRVVVLDKGEIVEFDTPAALMLRKGAFYSLVKEAGLAENLISLD